MTRRYPLNINKVTQYLYQYKCVMIWSLTLWRIDNICAWRTLILPAALTEKKRDISPAPTSPPHSHQVENTERAGWVGLTSPWHSSRAFWNLSGSQRQVLVPSFPTQLPPRQTDRQRDRYSLYLYSPALTSCRPQRSSQILHTQTQEEKKPSSSNSAAHYSSLQGRKGTQGWIIFAVN